MLLVIDTLVYVILLFIISSRKWYKYEYFLAFLLIGLSYFFLWSEYFSINFLIYALWLFFLGKLFLKNKAYVLSVSFLYGYSSFVSIALLTGNDFWDLFLFINDFNIHVLFVFFIKLCILIPLLLFLKKTILENLFLIKLQNSNSHSLIILVLILFVVHDIAYYQSLGLNTSFFYSFILFITTLVYVFSIFLIYVYYGQYISEERIKQKLVAYNQEIDTINTQFQKKIIQVLTSYNDSNNMTAMKDYTQQYLDKNFIFAQKQKLKGIEDEQVVLMINERIIKYSNVNFEIVNHNFTLDHVSSMEKYFLEMFGIILDNAVENAMKSEEKRVEIIFSESNVVIKNTYTTDDLKRFKEKRSDKGDSKRMNGLKILKYLNSKSDMILVSDVSDMVSMKMMVISC